jgi:hypothetical protein
LREKKAGGNFNSENYPSRRKVGALSNIMEKVSERKSKVFDE